MPQVIMPKMGDAMEEGTLLKWLKNQGDEVAEGDALAEIETDKVTLEIEATDAGVLTKTLVGEGDTVPIGTPIATIGEDGAADGQDVPAAIAEAPSTGEEAGQAPPPAGADRQEQAREEPPTVEAARAQAASVSSSGTNGERAPVAPTWGTGESAHGMEQVADEQAQAAEQPGPESAQTAERGAGDRLRASPIVKRLAAEHGIDLTQVVGSGPGGRIVKDDIKDFISGARPAPRAGVAPAEAALREAPQPEGPAEAPPSQPAALPAAAAPRVMPQELSRIKQRTGERMAFSKQTIPHYYVTSDVAMDAAMAFREQVNAALGEDGTRLSVNDLIIKAAALALRENPNVNTAFEDGRIYQQPRIDINIAIALDGGLIAPFIPAADEKSLGAISRMAKDLGRRAREGGLKPEEYQGGTFTISNLGMFDIAEFIAVINPPQAAILAVGSVQELPVVRDGEVTVGQRMKITLSADHRALDGAEVARFLQAVTRYLQNPMLLALS
jgi:pyruvate dehydrogenase E2 component (dihydrolipoamide acetyltransferase)